MVKEEEKMQLELLRSFVEKISTGERLEKVRGSFAGGTKETIDLINHSTENISGM